MERRGLVKRRLRGRARVDLGHFVEKALPARDEPVEVLLHAFAPTGHALHEALALRIAGNGFAVPGTVGPGARARRVAAVHTRIEGVRGRDELPSLRARY